MAQQQLEEILINTGLLNNDQLKAAQAEQKRLPRPLHEIIVDLNFVDADQTQEALSQTTGYPCVHLSEININPLAYNLIDTQDMIQKRLIIFDRHTSVLHVAMSDPQDIRTRDLIIQKIYNTHDFIPVLQCYHADLKQIQQIIHKLTPSNNNSFDSESTAISIVDELLKDAIHYGASDIHIHPQEQVVEIKMRCDGKLSTHRILHKNIFSMLINRLKVLSSMDITQQRLPQHGNFHKSIVGHDVDLRLSTHPTIYGESMVIRLLDKSRKLLTLKQLGFSTPQINTLKSMIQKQHGMILFCGPTGSGKTSTMYALLQEMDRKSRNVMTLEEPVEYKLSDVRQSEIKSNFGFDFSDGVRSMLRQDPDVMLIGEIRDEATAQMALRASMTGHLVLSTIHTQDAFGVPARLIDLGVAPHLLCGQILGIVGQRLVRKNQEKGRTVVAEVIPVSEAFDQIIARGGNRRELLKLIDLEKYKTIADHMKEKRLKKQIQTEDF